MELVSRSLTVSDKTEKQTGDYTNYRIISKYMGGSDVVEVPKEVYDNVEIGDDVKLVFQWFYNNKRKKYVTYCSGMEV